MAGEVNGDDEDGWNEGEGDYEDAIEDHEPIEEVDLAREDSVDVDNLREPKVSESSLSHDPEEEDDSEDDRKRSETSLEHEKLLQRMSKVTVKTGERARVGTDEESKKRLESLKRMPNQRSNADEDIVREEILASKLGKSLAAEQIDHLARSAEFRQPKQGEVLVTQGDYATEFYIILSGNAGVYARQYDESGKEFQKQAR